MHMFFTPTLPECNTNMPFKSNLGPLGSLPSSFPGNVASRDLLWYSWLLIPKTFHQVRFTECFWCRYFEINKGITKRSPISILEKTYFDLLPQLHSIYKLYHSFINPREWNSTKARDVWGKKRAEEWIGLWDMSSRQITQNQESRHHSCFSQGRPWINIS